MKQSIATPVADFVFPYNSCRNITSPEDDAAGRRVYSGTAPSTSILGLEDNENVREYIVDAPGKGRSAPTLVHQAIRKTLADHPDDFSILNGGVTVVAHAVHVDDKTKVLSIRSASIVNGSQTQGELKRYFERTNATGFVPSIKYELIVTEDEDLIAEISIARNFQNDVRAISIAGRRGQLDELESAVQKVLPEAALRKSETQIVATNGAFLDTEKLIQVIFALMPSSFLAQLDLASDSKVFTYSQKTRCLKLFQRIVDDSAGEFADVYRYCLDIAGDAWLLYEKWKTHPEWRGTRLRAIEREGSEIIDVPDGIVFPIIASLSAFAQRTRRKKWEIKLPAELDEKELIEAAKQTYMEIADSNPQTMGKSRACYSSLLRVTMIYARLNRQ